MSATDLMKLWKLAISAGDFELAEKVAKQYDEVIRDTKPV